MVDFNIFKLTNQNIYLSALSEDNQYIFISSRQGGIHIISLQNIIQPAIINNIPTLYSQYLQIKKNILFIGDLLDGLLIYDISNINNPILLSKWQQYLQIQSVIVTSDLRYGFAVGNGIVYCIDLKDLKNPKTLSKNGVPSGNSVKIRLSPDETHLSLSNNLSGIQIIDIRQKNNIILRVNQNPALAFWDCLFTLDQSSIYAVDTYYGLFYGIAQPIFLQPEGTIEQIKLKFFPIFQSPQVQLCLEITQDGQFLALGQRSVGLILFEINSPNYQNLKFIQRINSEYLSNNIIFSKNNNEAYTFVVNGLSLQIFKQVAINTNKDFPNIFNTFQSSLTYLTPAQIPWQVICLSNRKYIIQTNSGYGLKILDIQDNYNPKVAVTIPTIQGQHTAVQVNQQEDTLYVGAQVDGLILYNITDISQIKFINKFAALDPNQTKSSVIGQGYFCIEQIVSYNYNNSLLLIANTFQGFSVLNATNSSQLEQIGLFNNKQYQCSFQKCQITNDTTTIICGCREIGLLFFDFTDKKLKQTYLLDKFGAEYLILSQNENYAFVCFGFMGLVIVDIQNKYQPRVLSIQPLDGWAQSLTTLFDEKYLLISQIEKGQLVVVNIEDLQNPYIQSKLHFLNENSNSACITSDKKSAYFIGNKGLRYIPIDTNLVLHTQIHVKQINEQGNIFYQDLEIGQSLLVGQTAQVFFVPLYIQSLIKIQNAFYYRNFQLQTLPFWITFYSQTQYLQIQVDKTGAINTFSNEIKGENIIVLQCLISLNANNFVTQNINQTLSKQIYQNLVNQGYLDNYGFLTPKLDPAINFYLNFFDNQNFTEANVGTAKQIQQIQNDIKQILVFSLVQYPIRFFVQSSLFFNYKQTKSTDYIISTPSLQIDVLIQIISNGKFIKKQLDGVIASYSDDQTSLQIQGQTKHVNQIISQGLQIANQTSNLTECVLDFIISDSNNFDITKQIPLSNLKFVSIYSPIQVFQQNKLQLQLNKQFSDGHLQVESRFQFSFDSSIFRQKDNLTITYTAFLVLNDNSLVQITTGTWIEFNALNLGFSGYKSINSLLQSYRIRIVATDNYSTIYDEFVIEFTQIPFLYIVSLFVQIVGPLLGIFGIWKYRSEIYTFTMKRFYLYSIECAVVGQVYKKQIVLMNKICKDAENLWKLFLSNNKDTKTNIVSEYEKDKSINIQQIINQLFQVFRDNQKKFPNIDPREFEFNDSRLFRVIKRFCYDFILKKDKNTQFVLSHLIKIGSKTFTNKDWYKQFATINYNFEVSKNKIVQESSKKDKFSNRTPIITSLQSPKLYQIDNQNISLDIINKNQDLNNEQNIQTDRKSTHNILKYCYNEQVSNNNMISKEQMPELDNNGSKYMQGISNSQIQFGLQSPVMSNLESILFEKKRDGINIDNYDDDDENLNPFPEIVIKDDQIQKIIEIKFPNLKYDLNLLSEIIILEISGILMKSPSRINPTRGESLHLYSHQLLSVQAFKRDKEDSYCYNLKKFFKANYSPIGLNQNNPLPQWLNCQIINGIIHIWGTPKTNDEPEILVKIIDQLTFTILSFHLHIKDKEGVNLNEKRKNILNQSYQSRQDNLDVSSKNIKSKQLQQIPTNQINQQNIYKGNFTERLSKFSKDLSNQQKKVTNQLEISKNQLIQEQSIVEFDTTKDKKLFCNIEQELTQLRDKSQSESYQAAYQQSKQSVFKKEQLNNKNYNEPGESNVIEDDKNLDDEDEEQGRDYDDTKENKTSRCIAISNYLARK